MRAATYTHTEYRGRNWTIITRFVSRANRIDNNNNNTNIARVCVRVYTQSINCSKFYFHLSRACARARAQTTYLALDVRDVREMVLQRWAFILEHRGLRTAQRPRVRTRAFEIAFSVQGVVVCRCRRRRTLIRVYIYIFNRIQGCLVRAKAIATNPFTHTHTHTHMQFNVLWFLGCRCLE